MLNQHMCSLGSALHRRNSQFAICADRALIVLKHTEREAMQTQVLERMIYHTLKHFCAVPIAPMLRSNLDYQRPFTVLRAHDIDSDIA